MHKCHTSASSHALIQHTDNYGQMYISDSGKKALFAYPRIREGKNLASNWKADTLGPGRPGRVMSYAPGPGVSGTTLSGYRPFSVIGRRILIPSVPRPPCHSSPLKYPHTHRTHLPPPCPQTTKTSSKTSWGEIGIQYSGG